MASNLDSAKQAIEAELSHARQGVAYYMDRVKALESALQQLESVEGDGHATAAKEKPRTRAKYAKSNGGAKRGRKPRVAQAENGARRRSSASALPSTGSEFWLDLVNDQPRSAVDIANAAIAALGIKPDQKTEIQKLKQRVSPALSGLVSAQKIKDAGAGRERRFFRNGNHAS